MTQQALARKWRPRDFADLIGQAHVVRALSHALTTGRLHHAYLFTGTRGVGKTTISRIFAKALNCENGITATPCNRCRACQEIDADRFPDYVEMDAASNRGVDEMAALLEQAAYAPVAGRFKVYMIDEVHMLTGHAFNAMLKTLEEPPEHVKFVLATTDPQKIPVTVLSRCLQFALRALAPEAIAERCAAILTAEGVSFEPAALSLIGQAARGSMRDALSLLDQAIVYGAGRVTEEHVRSMLGLVGEAALMALLTALADGDLPRYWQAVSVLVSSSMAADALLAQLAQRLHQIARSQFGAPAFQEPQLIELARRWDPEFVQLAYEIVIQGRRQLPLAPDEATGLEMTLLRLLAFAPQTVAEPPPLPPGPALEPNLPDGTACVPAATPLSDAAPDRASAPIPSRAEQLLPRSHNAGEQEAVTTKSNEAWLATVAQLPLSGVLRTFAEHCALIDDDGTTWTIGVDRPAHHWLETAPEWGQRLQQTYDRLVPSQRRWRFVAVTDEAMATLARRREAAAAKARSALVAAAQTHPGVRLLAERLELTIDPEAIVLNPTLSSL